MKATRTPCEPRVARWSLAATTLLILGCADEAPVKMSEGYATSGTGDPVAVPPSVPSAPSTTTDPPAPTPTPTAPTIPTGDATLQGAPLLFSPTPSGFGVNAALATGDPATLFARVRVESTEEWGEFVAPDVRATDVAEWQFTGLDAGTRYEYEITRRTDAGDVPLYTGVALTARPAGSSFSFALISDTHIGSDLTYYNQGYPDVLEAVSAQVVAVGPDFLLNLGDILDFHQFGFVPPIPTAEIARQAYVNYRTLLGDTAGHVAHFPVIGNWDGENGHHTEEEVERARSQRLLYLPGPNPATYPEGGGPNQDYYAFTWGDALFVVLNVMTYTPTAHLLSTDPGLPDDWTLGAEQLDWLANTLAAATSKWRFLFIHHTVGGAAGNEVESAYGRGGGQAAYVGEQAVVHQLMIDHGVQIFFYGHDHVFTDMVVDGIHYTMPSNAGARWVFEESETGYTEYWTDSGFATVDVTPDTVGVRFVTQTGDAVFEYAVP